MQNFLNLVKLLSGDRNKKENDMPDILKSKMTKITCFVAVPSIVAMLSFSDDILKFGAGQAVQLYLDDIESNYGASLSSTLMLKCVNGDVSPFTRSDLDALNPEYASTVEDAIHKELVNKLDLEINTGVSSLKSFGLSGDILDESYKKAKVIQNKAQAVFDLKDATVLVNTFESDTNFIQRTDDYYPLHDGIADLKTYNKGRQEILTDFARAMGNFTYICEGDAKTCMITDYFDFEVTPNASNFDLLKSSWHSYNGGNYDEAARSLGQVFCQEGQGEEPTSTSIPILIEVDRPEL